MLAAVGGGVVAGDRRRQIASPVLACRKMSSCRNFFWQKVQNLRTEFPISAECRDKIEILSTIISVGNWQLSVGKLQLFAHPTFVTRDATGYPDQNPNPQFPGCLQRETNKQFSAEA